MKLDIITKQIVSLSKKVGSFIKSEVNNLKFEDIETKSHNSLVTYVDKTAEKMIVSELRKLVPEAGFIAEEDSSLAKSDDYNWVIDPLDGTTNFIHGLPPFSISIALAKGVEPIIGVVYEVNLDECYYAWKGGNAFLNGNKISVSKTNQVQNSLIATGFPYHDFRLMPEYVNLLSELMKSSRGIRRLGSAAVDLVYVAAGRFDVFYEYGLNPWDVAAGICIVKEAGGTVTDFNDGYDAVFSGKLIASNALIHKEFSDKVKTHMNNNE